MKDDIKISVCMITYNHESYIRQALDSILMQRGNISYEIIIGDDASKDHTPTILKEYESNYPEIFTLFLRDENIGVTKNFYDILCHANGKFIAILEGDDYWTDPLKLKKQYDFMCQYPEYSGCIHDYKIIDNECSVINEHGFQCKDFLFLPYQFKNQICTLNDYENTMDIPSHMNTLFVKNFMLDRTKDFSYMYRVNDSIADQTIYLTVLCLGNLYRMNDNMSVYRFISKKGQDNVTSIFKEKNMRYVHYIYQTNMEKELKNTLGIDVDLSKYKRNLLIGATCLWLKQKNKQDFEVVLDILKCSDNKFRNRLLFLKVIILKTIGRVLNKEMRIKV